MPILAEYLAVMSTATIPLALLFVLERLFPVERKQPIRHYLFNLGYFAAALLIIMNISPPLMQVQAAIHEALGPLFLFTVPPIESLWAKLAVGLALVFVWDVFYYWTHRAMHALPWLWEIHKLHHSEKVLSAPAAQRIHLGSYLLGAFTVTLPVSMLFDGFVLPWLLVTLFYNGYAYFNHANLRLSLGFLTPVLMGPQLHRLHHSVFEKHVNRNYAAFFPVIDVVFGTYCAPEKGEFPPTGLASGEQMNDLRSVTVAPVVGWSASLALWARAFAAREGDGYTRAGARTRPPLGHDSGPTAY